MILLPAIKNKGWIVHVYVTNTKSTYGICKNTTNEEYNHIPTTWIKIEVGGGRECNTISMATVAHEAVHAATMILKDPHWKEWAPKWEGIRHHKEETMAWIVESIVGAVYTAAIEHGSSFSAAVRDIYKGNI